MTGHRVPGSAGGQSPILAAILSALLPGAGQWYAGHRLRGTAFAAPLFVAIVVIAAGSIAGTIGPRSILTWAVQPDLLRVSLIVSVVIFVWHVAAIVDAYLISGERSSSPRYAPIVLVGLFLVIAAPQVAAATYTVRGIELLEEKRLL